VSPGLPWPLGRLGLYGGSFDPVHNGHLDPVEEARRSLGLDAVLFVPAHSVPHKPAGTSAGSHHRFAMVALAVQQYSRFVVTDFEAVRGGTVFTVETLRHFRAVLPGTEIVLLMGSDSLLTLPSWREWREILAAWRIGVLHREPVGYDEMKAGLDPEISARLAPRGRAPGDGGDESTIYWAGNAPVTISSTWIRKAIMSGASLDASLPPAVEAYARRQRLYLPA
jgi:nicotinate (nicotinamide) nucleotide adenylyltransferase